MHRDPVELLREHHLVLKKRKGQCFLVNREMARRVVEAAALDPARDVVVEVGTGLGILTALMAPQAKRVITYELDAELAAVARAELAGLPNVEVVHADALEVAYPPHTKIVSNVPFQISGPLLSKIVQESPYERAVLVLQEEFARRLVARPGEKNYSRISAWVSYLARVEYLFTIHAHKFLPSPRVHAWVVALEPSGVEMTDATRAAFLDLLRGIFPYKNKKLRNGLYYFWKRRGAGGRTRVDNLLAQFQQQGGKANEGEALPASQRKIRDLAPETLHALARFLAREGSL